MCLIRTSFLSAVCVSLQKYNHFYMPLELEMPPGSGIQKFNEEHQIVHLSLMNAKNVACSRPNP